MKAKLVEAGLVTAQSSLIFSHIVTASGERNFVTSELREGGIGVALEEAVDQPLRPGRQAELRRAGLLREVLRPGDQLVIGERVDVGAFGEIFERLLVGGHDVGRLHPRNVLLLAGAELAEAEIGLVDADARTASRRDRSGP